MNNLESKFAGAILGCAVGDALGAPFEGYRRGSLPPSKELLESFVLIPGYPLGQYTDDTQMTLAIAESLIERGEFDARDIAERFAVLWTEKRIVGAGASCTEGVMNFVSGVSPDKSGSPPGRAGNGSAMRASPIGLWFHDDFDGLVEVSRAQSVVTHLDDRASAGAAAVSYAVALALNEKELDPKSFLDNVARAAQPYSPELAGYIRELLPQLEYDEDDTLPWITTVGMAGPARWIGGVTPFVISTVLAALYEFLRHPDDWGAAVTAVIGCGGDVDTTGAIVGAIAGARLGIDAIPKHLTKSVKDSDYIHLVAKKLYQAAIAND